MSSRSFTGYPFTGRRFTGYPFTGVQFGEVLDGLDILALFYKGSIPYYTSYTREGLAYTSAGTFAQDVPPYEIVDGKKRFVQYESPNNPPGITPPQPVNKGTTLLITEDIDDASYNFSNTGNETVNTGLLKQALTSVSFNIRLRTTNGDAITQCPKDTSDAMVAVTSGSGYAINFSHDGTDYVSDTELAFNTSYLIELTNAGVLSVNGTPDTLSAGASYTFTSTDILFGSRGTDLHIDGYMWDVKYYDTDLIAWYKCAEYRQDVLSPDSSGLGNDGTIINATLTDFRVENQGFGYPVNELARLPWTYTTDDGVVVPYGLRELFGGTAKGINKWIGSEVLGAGWVALGNDRYQCDGTQTTTSTIDKATSVSIGDLIETSIIVESISAGGVVLRAGQSFTGYKTEAGTYIERSTATNPLACRLQGDSSFIGIVEVKYSRKVSPATFSIPFTKYIPHGTTEDIPFIQHTTNDFVPFYRELTTGLIKGTDGTNTCVSTSAATEGSTVSGWFSFNGPENEMWITLDGVKGAVATCLDALPDVGNRLFGLTSGTYHSIETLYVYNELPFEYVYLNGELVTHEGEPVTVYL